MFNWFKAYLSPQAQAKRDLREAQLALLEADANLEHFKGLSTILKARVQRLQAYTNDSH